MDEYLHLTLFRSSHSQIFFKIKRFQKFCNIHRKTPVLESLFNKFADLKFSNLIKKKLKHRYVLVNIEKFLGTTFL